MEFIDTNWEDITKEKHVTNEFGTFHGHFEIPLGKLNGLMHLSTDYGQIGIQVEEYKRPTFEVKFDSPRESYRLGDSIQVKGRATSFSGYQVGQASVRYTVYRTVETRLFEVDASSRKPISTGTTFTNNDGSFNLKFFASKSGAYRFSNGSFLVRAEVTDPSGETQFVEKNIRAGEKDLVVNSFIPEFLFLSKKADTIQASIQNLNGQPIKAGITIEWFLLQPPARLTHKRPFGELPEKYKLDRDAFVQRFPYETYMDEDNVDKWPEQSMELKQQLSTESGKIAMGISSNQLKIGYYKVRISAYNSQRDTVNSEQIVRIYNEQPEQILTMNDWLRAEKLQVTPTEQAVFRIAGMTPDAMAYYEVYYRNKITEKVWVTLSNTHRIIKIAPKSDYEGGFAVQFTMIQQGVNYKALHTISILNDRKELDIKFLSFRNKLEPGQ
ncbi:MAG: hypothetical protein EOO88_50560, partial [Pedobacter sp.]